MSNCNTLFVICLNPASPNPSYALAFDDLGRVIETTTDPLNARAWFAFPAAAAAAALVVGRDFVPAVKEITANDSAVTAACTEWRCVEAAAKAAAEAAAEEAASEAAAAAAAATFAFAKLLRIKAHAEDAAAAVAAAMISARASKTRSFDAQALNAQAQRALVTLAALASATAAAQRREEFERDLAASTAAVAAENERATRAAAALKEHNRLECAAAHRAAGEAASALKALRDHNMAVLLTLGYDDQLEVIRAVFAHALGEGLCVGTESLRETSPVGTMSAAGIRLHADAEGVMADFGEAIGTATVLNA